MGEGTGGAYKDWPEDMPEIIFLQKWKGQEILVAADWSSHTKSKQKDKTGQATHISGQSL